MAKAVKFWMGKPLKGGETEMKRTLKGLCEITGIKYSTIKAAIGVNPGLKGGDKRIFVVRDQAWEVWTEMKG